MFTLSGGSSGADMVLLAPMLGQVDDGPELEIVDFFETTWLVCGHLVRCRAKNDLS